jgi:hypothetical protein
MSSNSLKCPTCGLVNFQSNRMCKRCETPLHEGLNDQVPFTPTGEALGEWGTDASPRAGINQSPLHGYAVILLLALLLILTFWNSLKAEAVTPRFEYKVLEFMTESNERTGTGALKYSSIIVSQDQLAALGNEGWELVSNFVENETAFPNFGDSQYVTGIQPNIRPQRAVLLFKRRIN